MKRYLINIGDTNKINNWSGIPYFFLNSAKNQSFSLKGLNLKIDNYNFEKIFWNFKQLMKYGSYSGFQYSEYLLNKLMKKANLDRNEELTIISHYPQLPNGNWPENWNIFYYIDATTKQVFNNYCIHNKISKEYKRKIIDKEKLNFQNSRAIFCFSDWARNSLLNDYEVSPKKVFVIPGGANVHNNDILKYKKFNFYPQYPSYSNPLRIGFLGKEWERKGGPFLIDLVKYLNDKKIPTTLRIVGVEKSKVPDNKFVKNIGFINKENNVEKFIEEISSWHYGTLFSSAEAYGCSNRECLILGVPIICRNVGGISSTLPDKECGKLFDIEDKFDVVGDWIINQIANYSHYLSLRENLSRRYREFSWDYSLRNLFNEILRIENSKNKH